MYPSISVDAYLSGLGLDINRIGYQRIHYIQKKIESPTPREVYFNDNQISYLKKHPYIKKINNKQISFKDNFYSEAIKFRNDNEYLIGTKTDKGLKIGQLLILPADEGDRRKFFSSYFFIGDEDEAIRPFVGSPLKYGQSFAPGSVQKCNEKVDVLSKLASILIFANLHLSY